LAKKITISEVGQHVGEEVTLQGWLYAKTGKGKLNFLKVRDGTGIIQAVAFKGEISDEAFEVAKGLTQESSLTVTGTVRADERAPGFPGGYEISLSDLQQVQLAEEYPITPKEHGTEFLMDNRHLWLRSNRQWAILRIRATVIRTIRNWLDDHGYLLVDTPILSGLAGENSTDLFAVDYFGEPAYLAQTGQLYNEANMMSFGKV
jgi:asparaginyl-tRNA synthetase